MNYRLMLVAVPALMLGACGGQPAATTTNTADNVAMADGSDVFGNTADNMAMAPGVMTGQQFADTMAASDMFELDSAKLAQEKATSAPLKEFAAMMIKDHTASSAKLKEAAGKADPALTPAPTMTAEQTANLEALRAASGDAFDALYKEQQVAAHQQALTTLQTYASSGDVPALKTFASETAPVVDGHLKHVSGL